MLFPVRRSTRTDGSFATDRVNSPVSQMLADAASDREKTGQGIVSGLRGAPRLTAKNSATRAT